METWVEIDHAVGNREVKPGKEGFKARDNGGANLLQAGLDRFAGGFQALQGHLAKFRQSGRCLLVGIAEGGCRFLPGSFGIVGKFLEGMGNVSEHSAGDDGDIAIERDLEAKLRTANRGAERHIACRIIAVLIVHYHIAGGNNCTNECFGPTGRGIGQFHAQMPPDIQNARRGVVGGRYVAIDVD